MKLFVIDTLQEANEFVEHRKRLRSQLPAVYSLAKANELPLPNILQPGRNEIANEPVNEQLSDDSNESSENTVDFDENDDDIDFEQSNNISINEHEIQPNQNAGEQSGFNNEEIQEPLIEEQVMDQAQSEVSDPLATIKAEADLIHNEDISEIADGIIHNNEEDESEITDDTIRDHEENEYERIDEDVSIRIGGEFLPFISTVELKTNDAFSGNRPFFEFVSKIFKENLRNFICFSICNRFYCFS